MRELPTINEPVPMLDLSPQEVEEMAREVRELAHERDAVILAHNYQVPEVQDVADYTGDSLGLSRKAAESAASVIAFCGVHFMAETASILSPEKTVLIPDLAAGCSLADSISAGELRNWKSRHSPDAIVVMYVNTSAEVKAETDYCCTSSNAVKVVEHILREHGPDTEILFGPDMWLGSYVERETGHSLHVWPGVHMLSTGQMLDYVQQRPDGEYIVATENGMLHPLQQAAPAASLIEANRMAYCKYMKMITLPKLRDALREMKFEVSVPAEIAERARLPIERMVAIG